MRALLSLAVAAVALVAQVPPENGPQRDGAVLAILRRAEPSLPTRAIWRREPVTETEDLVLALAAPTNWMGLASDGSVAWWPGMKLGLFLQDRTRADRVFTLGVVDGPSNDDCFGRLLRVTSTDIVYACRGERRDAYEHRKFLIDVRAKTLAGAFTYAPVGMHPMATSFSWATRSSTTSPTRVVNRTF